MNTSNIYDTECITKPNGYNPDQELFLVGTGDSDKCNSIVLSIFDFKTCNSSQCSFNGVEQPPVTGGFMVTHSGNIEHIQEETWKWKTYVMCWLFPPGICRILLRCEGAWVWGNIRFWSIQRLYWGILPHTLESGKFFQLVCGYKKKKRKGGTGRWRGNENLGRKM